MNKLFTLLIFLFVLLSKGFSQSTTIALWNYDGITGTPATPTANVGSGTSLKIGSFVVASAATGMDSSINAGCGTQNGVNPGAWAFTATPGATNESSGVQYNASTVGHSNIVFTWDQRSSGTAVNTVRLQYTLNGTIWTNFTMTVNNTTFCLGELNDGRFQNSASGDQYRRVSVNLSSITGANNNADFGVRILAAHYQTSGQFRQTSTQTSVATGGTMRFDNVSFKTAIILPLSLLSFNAKTQGNNTLVEWKSNNEINHKYYEVVYSTDGSNFIQAGQRNALVGSGEKVYTLTHQNASLLGSKLFYRLKMVSTTGVVTYSNIVIVRFGKQVQGITDVYPNPTTGIVTLIANATEQVQLNLIDASGKIIVSKQVFINNTYNLDLTKYANGIYILEATLTNGNKQQFKVVKK